MERTELASDSGLQQGNDVVAEYRILDSGIATYVKRPPSQLRASNVAVIA